MGLDAIIHFILDVIDGKPIPKKKAAGTSVAPPAAEVPVEAPPLHPVAQEWNELQNFCASCESENLPLAGLNVEEPETYWAKRFAIEEAQAKGKLPFEAALASGFNDDEHWKKVDRYFTAKWSELGKDEQGEPLIKAKDEFYNAAARVRLAQQKEAAAQVPAPAMPDVLAPIDGVNVEQWAAAQSSLARMPPNASPADVHAVLANFAIDPTIWESVNPAWNARMREDTTGAIAMKYGDAFAGKLDIQKAQGAKKDPCTFEMFCEILAAQEVWALTGKDVNIELRSVFQISAVEWGAFAAHWSPRVSSDVNTAKRFGELHAKFKEKYEKMA